MKLFPSRDCLVSDIPAGDGKMANIFLQCRLGKKKMERENKGQKKEQGNEGSTEIVHRGDRKRARNIGKVKE